MTNLSSLTVLNKGLEARFFLDWGKLVSLAHLYISGSVKFVSPLSKLAIVGTLRRVVLQLGSLDTQSVGQAIRQIGELAHKLGLERPEVQLTL